MADEHNISLLDHTTGSPPVQPLSTTSSTNSPSPSHPETSHIDILYENQRGWFIFGLPLFSSKALWNLKIDQSPWVDARFKPSAVNITNAQVPDPSWVWDWKSWYVDMSYDVDEEGWQYSLWFRGGTAWHGNHPWFHSFVRRRRWLRRRVKRKTVKRGEGGGAGNGAETFSIGAGTMMSRTLTQGTSMGFGEKKEMEKIEEEIRDVPTLMRMLKIAAIDREKIVYINRFIEEGGEELHYLAEQIPTIMTMLVFQNSRRQLLATLTTTINAARAHRDHHLANHTPESAAEERRINNLLKAVEAADAECRKLEYWSDIRGLAEKGQAVNAVSGESWGKGWEGLDRSGPSHPEGKGERGKGS